MPASRWFCTALRLYPSCSSKSAASNLYSPDPSLCNGRGFAANAALTLKGITVTEPFLFTLSEEGNTTIMNGSTTLKRKPLNLGQDSDPKGNWVSEEIAVSVTVAASRN